MAWHVDSIVVSMDRWSQDPTIRWMSPALAEAPEQFPFQREGRTEWQNGYSLRDAEMHLAISLLQSAFAWWFLFLFLCFAAISIHLRIRFLARMYSRARNVPWISCMLSCFFKFQCFAGISADMGEVCGCDVFDCLASSPRLPGKISLWTRNLHPQLGA